jgi:ABC-type transport system involved in multi-copper enzyme maturation permease subunit
VKQLINKELREQSKVAVLGFIVFTVLLVLAFSASADALKRIAYSSGYSDAEGFQPLLSQAVLTQAAFFCAIFGALLGWLQIHAEAHPDLWAFLVHRPIPRSAILRSKVVSGLLLYAAAAGLPLLGFIIVAAVPGKVAAPFEWTMVLPLVAIFLVGIVFYLAGLLTGLRKARWYGSRGFGLGLAVVTALGVFVANEFWQALLMITGAAMVLALAVRGSFLAGGYYRGQPALSKVSLAVASAVSAMLLIGVLIAMAVNLFWSPYHYTYSQYQLTRDGTVIRITQRDRDDVEAVDLNGKPVVDEQTGRKLKVKDLQMRYAMAIGTTADFGDRVRKGWWRPGYSQARRYFHPWRIEEKTLWYLTRQGRLVGYDGISRRAVASLAPTGGNSGSAPDDTRFLRPYNYYTSFQPYQMPEILPSARTAYLVDLEKRELKPFFAATNGDAIGGYSQQISVLHPASSNLVLIVTRSSVRLMDYEQKTRFAVPFKPGPPDYPSVNIAFLESTNRYAVRFDPDYFANQQAGGKLPSHIQWLDSAGNVRNVMDLPILPPIERESFAEKCMLAFLPIAFPLYPLEQKFQMGHALRVVMAIICVLIGWRLARRNNLSPKAKIGWAIFHFLFGIPGVLAFVAVQEWPARERCLRCGKPRVVNRDQCEHCGASFAPPEKTGIEIFEPLSAP